MNKKQKLKMYPYGYVYCGKRTVLIWQTGEMDTFRKTPWNGLLQSQSSTAMKRTLKSNAAKVRWSEYSEMDFDRFWKVLRNLKTGRASSIITCTILLDGWNFIEDMGRTFSLKKDLKRLHSRLLNKAYDKLFYGCNLPAVTPGGKSYSPLWSHEEILSMRAELRKIWRTFRKQRYIQP